MTNVEKVSHVAQTIVQLHWDLMHTQIVVMRQLLEMRIFAQLMNLVKWMKVTVIPMRNVKAICFVDQRIVLIHLDFHLQLTAVNQKVIKLYLLCFSHCPYNLYSFVQLLIESCVLNYCQDGLQVYFATETQQFTSVQIYGHYELQSKEVNGRLYFKKGSFGFWWDGIQHWFIGEGINEGQPYGFAYYETDVFCPHQLSEVDGLLLDLTGPTWYSAGDDLVITCK